MQIKCDTNNNEQHFGNNLHTATTVALQVKPKSHLQKQYTFFFNLSFLQHNTNYVLHKGKKGTNVYTQVVRKQNI